jgi:hypothetical protein
VVVRNLLGFLSVVCFESSCTDVLALGGVFFIPAVVFVEFRGSLMGREHVQHPSSLPLQCSPGSRLRCKGGSSPYMIEFSSTKFLGSLCMLTLMSGCFSLVAQLGS